MAGKDSLFAKVVIAGEYKNLAKSTRGATKELKGFEKAAKKISGAVKAAFAGIALGGIGMLADAIVDMAKAAAEDNRSMALLNEQMKRTWNGNETLNKSIDKQIDAMSNATGIADDKLRPALIRIAAVTKTPEKGMKMLGLATDIAAKSGSDLNLVSRNMAKFLGGNKTALDKLVPGLSTAGNRMKFLTDNYEGFAEISGQNDPFGRISIIMENFQEKLGTAFLPLFNQFADWLSSDDATKMLDDLATAVQNVFAWFGSEDGQKALKDFGDLILSIGQYISDLLEAWDLFMGIYDTNIFEIPGLTRSDQNTRGIPTTTAPSSPIATPIVNVTVSPITGKQTTQILKSYAGGKGLKSSQVF